MSSHDNRFKSLAEFYPFYLSQHQNKFCRRLHFIGTGFSLVMISFAFYLQTALILLVAVITGYLFAWIGHFVFEKNKPATFEYPLNSFLCDWLMFRDILLRRLPW